MCLSLCCGFFYQVVIKSADDFEFPGRVELILFILANVNEFSESADDIVNGRLMGSEFVFA